MSLLEYMLENAFIPHWSVFCSGVWRGPTRWRKLCYSPRAHTRTVSHQCASADESSGSPGESTLYYSLQTETQTHLHSMVFKKATGRANGQSEGTHSALVRFLSGMSAHVDDKHVLSFKRPLFSRAVLPVTHKLLLLSVYVLVIDVLLKTSIKYSTVEFAPENLQGEFVDVERSLLTCTSCSWVSNSLLQLSQ